MPHREIRTKPRSKTKRPQLVARSAQHTASPNIVTDMISMTLRTLRRGVRLIQERIVTCEQRNTAEYLVKHNASSEVAPWHRYMARRAIHRRASFLATRQYGNTATGSRRGIKRTEVKTSERRAHSGWCGPEQRTQTGFIFLTDCRPSWEGGRGGRLASPNEKKWILIRPQEDRNNTKTRNTTTMF